MNKTQKRIISWAIVAFLFIGLYPPWIETHIRTSVSVGHHLIFDPPTSETPRRKGIEIDFKRLLVYWSMVIFVGGAMVLGNKGDNVPVSEKPVE